MTWAWVLIACAIVALAFAYWALVITEGAYLGRRVVTWLYDRTPAYYDRIKVITWREDDEWLIEPLLRRLERVAHPLVLDVGTGTGRLPYALLRAERFDGQVWGLDASIGMLRRAAARLVPFGPRYRLLLDDADALPFPDAVFDAVTCLETLEFTPNPRHVLGELVRVLRPGGTLLISNRIGRARWFPGRTFDDDALLDELACYPLEEVRIHNWNSFYDLVWVRKRGEQSVHGRGADALETWLLDADRFALQGLIVRRSRWRAQHRAAAPRTSQEASSQ